MEERQNWLHLEIDRYVSSDKPIQDGIDICNLRNVWDEFWLKARPAGLANELDDRARRSGKEGCILTFSSLVVPMDQHLTAAHVKSWVLYGSAAECIAAFLSRESLMNRDLDENHWIANNAKSYITFSLPRFQHVRVQAFTASGLHRDWSDLLGEMRKRLAST